MRFIPSIENLASSNVVQGDLTFGEFRYDLVADQLGMKLHLLILDFIDDFPMSTLVHPIPMIDTMATFRPTMLLDALYCSVYVFPLHLLPS